MTKINRVLSKINIEKVLNLIKKGESAVLAWEKVGSKNGESSHNNYLNYGKNGHELCKYYLNEYQKIKIERLKENSLLKKFPGIAEEWHSTKNVLSPNEISYASNKKVWWKCTKFPDHEWDSSVNNRTTGGNGCSYCASKRVSATNRLDIIFPEVKKTWDYKKNKTLPNEYMYSSNKKVWWKCTKGPDHEWLSPISYRTKGKESGNLRNCPYCDGKKVSITNSFLGKFPFIAQEWHPTKNSDTPDKFTFGSNKKVWWKCEKCVDHDYFMSISSRTSRDRGCPYCAKIKICCSNNLLATHPNIAQEWHPTKNSDTPDNIFPASNKKVWWKCRLNPKHEWISTPNNRTLQDTGCHDCLLQNRSKEELTIANELMGFFKFDIKAHKVKDNKGIMDVDIIIPQINLLIEYDGYYWHKLKEKKDISKSKRLRNLGYILIRMRESPLDILHEDDIKVADNTKENINKLLIKIERVCNTKINGLEKYLKREKILRKESLGLLLEDLKK